MYIYYSLQRALGLKDEVSWVTVRSQSSDKFFTRNLAGQIISLGFCRMLLYIISILGNSNFHNLELAFLFI